MNSVKPVISKYYTFEIYTVNALNSSTLVLDNYLFTKKTEPYEDDDSDDYDSNSPILSIRK